MSSRRPRLLLLSPLPPPTGGIPTWTLGVLGSGLCDRWDVRVVNTSPSQKVAVHGKSRLRPDRVLDALRILAALLWQLVRFRPDVIHVNTPLYWAFLRDGAAVWLASLLGVRSVLHPRRGDFPEFVEQARPPMRRWIEATLRRADRCIALTRDNQRLLESIASPDRVCFVPNFVRLSDLGEPPDRGALTEQPERSERPVEVLFVGWMLEAKGVRELLAAARGLPRVRFTLVGAQQPDFVETVREELESQSDHLQILPPRAREEILELYRRADVFVLPSWSEGFPNVVLEAMAAGLPVVATPVGAIPDIVENGEEGLLVPPRDPLALEAAIRRLVESPELRLAMGRRARERVEAAFSSDAVIEQLEGVYSGLL